MIRGRFLLSISGYPDLRSIFKDFLLVPVSTTYQVGAKPRAAAELLISNLPEEQLPANDD